jgi:hypothetical protein
MNPLYGLLAAPAASTAIDFAGRTAKAAATPFELLLQAATKATEPTAASNDGDEPADESASLHNQVAQQLQQLLESLGVASRDRVTLRIDSDTGKITADDHALAGEIEAAVQGNSKLREDLRRLAQSEPLFGHSPFADSELTVELADEQGAATLSWR